MALEKQRMYRKNIDGTKDLIYRESSSDVVKHGSTTVEAKLNELSDLKDNGGSVGGVFLGAQDSVIDKIETSKTYLSLRTLGGRGTQLVITDDGVRPSTDQPNKINLGIPTTPYKDIFVGGCSIGTSGHTKLPNGMILQWGECKGTGAVSFPIPFPNACLQVFIDGMLSTSSSPIYKTLSCAFGFNKVNFTAVTYGYHDLGAQGTAQASMMYKNIVGSANFQGYSRWYAIGY